MKKMQLEKAMNKNLKMKKTERNEVKIFIKEENIFEEEIEVKIDGISKIEKNGKVVRIEGKFGTKKYIEITVYEAMKEYLGIAEAERKAAAEKEAKKEAKAKEEKRKAKNEKARKRYHSKKQNVVKKNIIKSKKNNNGNNVGKMQNAA